LQSWLKRHNSFTSHNIQNEILSLLSQAVLRKLLSDVKMVQPLQYSVIVDGTRDVSGIEQKAVCIRYVDSELIPHELFVGMYAAVKTTGKALRDMIADTLIRLNLDLSSMRGQTYDGAAAMAAQYNGCQALIRKDNPLALYVHCGAHCINLVMKAVASCTSHVRDPLQLVNELGSLATQSGKFKTAFVSHAAEAA
jgi:hypothetical protein